MADNGLWRLQLGYKSNKKCLVWKLTSSAKIWDLSEVTEAYSLASKGYSKLPNNRAARLSILDIKENKRSATFQPVIIDG